MEPLSFVMPVYNEAKIIEKVVRDYWVVLREISGSEMIIAEDGSNDGTKEVLKKLKEKIPFVLISGEKRKGYTQAVKDALKLPRNNVIFFSDSDGQHDPNDLFRLLEKVNGYDIVIGYKSPRRDPVHRLIISKGYNFIIGIMFGIWLKDIDCGFRLIRKRVVDNVLDETVTLKECVSSEYVIRAFKKGYKITEVPINHYPRQTGNTAIFSPKKLPFMIIGLLWGLIKIKLELFKNYRNSQ